MEACQTCTTSVRMITMHSSLFARSLLIFALLSALLTVQAGSLAHGISHALDEQSQDSEQSLPHDKYCDQCAAYAQIGGAIGSSGISFTSSENFETLHLSDSSSYISNSFVAFAARAPPYSA
jgi:hypothetical protein